MSDQGYIPKKIDSPKGGEKGPITISSVPLILIAVASAGLVLSFWVLSPQIVLPWPDLAYVVAFVAVTAMTLSSASVAPVLGWKGGVVTVVASLAGLGMVLLYGEHIRDSIEAMIVTMALLVAGSVVGGAVGGRIEHPGHLLAVVVVSLLVDTFSVFHSAGPTAAIVRRPAVIAVLALPWPVFGTTIFAPVLGVGDVIFAALYFAAARRFELGRWRTAVALAIGLLATMVGVMVTGMPLPALVGMGAAMLLAHPKARRLPRKDRKKALLVIGVLALLWVLLWLRQ